jgi:hypothetical protein
MAKFTGVSDLKLHVRAREFEGRQENPLRQWWDIVHDDDFELTLPTYLDAILTKKAFTVEIRMRSHDGSFRWFRVVGETLCRMQSMRWKVSILRTSCSRFDLAKLVEATQTTFLRKLKTVAVALRTLRGSSIRSLLLKRWAGV